MMRGRLRGMDPALARRVYDVSPPEGSFRLRSGQLSGEYEEYGTCKAAEGGPVRGRRVVVVEDVVTTGGALLDSCASLRAEGALVDTVVCAIDREQGGAANLLAEGLTLRAAFPRTDMEAAR